MRRASQRTPWQTVVSWLESNRQIIVMVFFAALYLLFLCIAWDYGVTYDEESQRTIGRISYEYVFNGSQELLTFSNRYYGSFVELSLYGLEKLFGLQDLHSIYVIRHGVTFLLFFVASFCFYGISTKLFRDWKWGLLATVMLAGSPRLLPDAAYNSKDLAFLSLFVIGMFTLLHFRERKTMGMAVLHGFACALAVDVRIIGILVPLFTVMICLLDTIFEKKKKRRRASLIPAFVLFPLTTASFIILFWPTLWSNPPARFLGALREMSNYPWNGVVLYWGEYIHAHDLPWHYIPVWILISVPLVTILFFIAGTLEFINLLFQKFWTVVRDDIALIFLWFWIPLTAAIVLGSTFYDGWRR